MLRLTGHIGRRHRDGVWRLQEGRLQLQNFLEAGLEDEEVEQSAEAVADWTLCPQLRCCEEGRRALEGNRRGRKAGKICSQQGRGADVASLQVENRQV